MKCVATDVITLAANQLARHISFSPQDDDTIIVTGKDVFKYYKVTDQNALKINHSSFNRKDDSQTPALSTNFVCHAWLSDGRFIVCTDIGQILLFESTGDFKNIQIFDPKKSSFHINSVLPFTMGQADA